MRMVIFAAKTIMQHGDFKQTKQDKILPSHSKQLCFRLKLARFAIGHFESNNSKIIATDTFLNDFFLESGIIVLFL